MDQNKAKRAKMDICEIMENVSKDDWRDPKTTEHLKNLAKLYGFYEAECLKGEYMGSSMRIGMSYADDGMGGIGTENASGRRMRGGNGQYMSGAMAAPYSGASYGGGSREQIMQLMQDPNLSYDAREHLRKAMESMR